MKPRKHLPSLLLAALVAVPAWAGPPSRPAPVPKSDLYWTKPHESVSYGSVTVDGRRIKYKAVAGTIILRNAKHQPAMSMFYVAYFKRGVNPSDRPITFFYNGGPGSSTVWLHMGAYGPVRIVTAPAPNHTPAAPYKIVPNHQSLLNVTDEVFVDAPATGFSRLLPDGNPKDYFGIDQDGHAFADFIVQFLSQFNRWNSPKYLYGESYGTTRDAVLAWILENDKNVDLNGVIFQSTILNFDTSIDGPGLNPGINIPYALALPTYAATSWYHKRLPSAMQSLPLTTVIKEAEHYAMHGYLQALNEGNVLSRARERQVAERLYMFTGISPHYWVRADLRLSGGEYEQRLMLRYGETTGRLDTRFLGPTMNPLARTAYYDPQSSAISQAYVAAFNWYTENVLKFGKGHYYRPVYYGHLHWSFKNRAPFTRYPQFVPNVILNLAAAMKYNPDLKVLVLGGYYDLATPFYAAWYQFEQLPISRTLEKNVTFHWFRSGHMIYVRHRSLVSMHAVVTRFIEETDNLH
jgi:carboxypeptidase C (cathepsin A)